MAQTFKEQTGDGDATVNFTFPSYQSSDVKVRVDGVLKTAGNHYNITNYTTTGGGDVVFTSGNIPNSPALIRIYRDTNVETAKATFTAGSSVKAADLNNNNTQLLYRAQEEQIPNLIHSYDIDDDAIETSKIKADAVTNAKIADDAITTQKINGLAVTEGRIANNAVTTAKLAADSVTNAKIADDSIDSEHYVDGSIDTAHIADAQITTAKIADNAVTLAKLSSGALPTDITITTSNVTDSSVTTAKLAANAVTTDKIADSSITNAKLGGGVVDTGTLAANAVTTAKIADNSITDAKIASGAVDTGELVDNAVTTAKVADSQITSAKIASNAVTTDKIADGELTTLAGMQSTTASNLASSTALTATTAELNQLDGITLETSLTGTSNTRIPTSKAVNDQILAVTNALGGFVAIANETSFPTSNPDPSNGAGTVVSISEVSSSSAISINSSGVATIANGAGTGNTVTITGFPTTLRNTSLAASSGLQVQTTTTLHTYTFHKQLASAADIAAISATVNSFSNRYRVSSSAPTSSLDGGDLWYDTTNSKLMVYSSQNSAWEEATAIGNFFISTISSSSNSGGGSATPNGTATRFTISNAPTSAAQLLVSVDGVIQKPNSGSSQPSEGFVLVGNDIIFGAAPANGASLFVTVIGSTVGIGTPSDNTVTTAILQNGSVTNAKIADSAISGSKIADGTITNADINASAAIAGSKLADGGITTAKIADQAVNADKITNGGVNTAKLADQSVTLAKIVHGTSSNDGKFLRANNGADPSFEVVNTDLVADTSPQLGGDLDINNYNVLFGDSTNANNDRLKFGAGTDLSIYHDGTHSRLNNTTGTLVLQSDAISLTNNAGNSNRISTHSNGEVKLYHSDSVKLQTQNTGIHVTGDVSITGHYLADDNERLKMGDGFDLQIYHDGSHSHIADTGTGNLNIASNTTAIVNAASNENIAVFKENAEVELYYDNSKKFETTTAGTQITGQIETVSTPNADPYAGFIARSSGSGNHCGFFADSATGANAQTHIRFGYSGNPRWQWRVPWHAEGTSAGMWLYDYSINDDVLKISQGGNQSIKGHVSPRSNNTFDLGTSSTRWRNIYTNDLNLSNKGSSNDVDGSWGDWTIQEGESDLFLKNNRSGKKYKFNLTEVS